MAGPLAAGVPCVDAEGLHDAVRLLAADFLVVEGDVAGDLGALDQAVIGDDLHARIRGLVHRRHNCVAILGNDDQGFHALADHVVDLVVLELDVVVGFLDEDFIAQFFQASLDDL